jgi:transmembrane sensor
MTRSGNIVNFPDRPPIDEEAARWVVRVGEGNMSAAQRAEFETWRQASPQHAEAFARLTKHWDELDELGALSRAPSRQLWSRPAIWGVGGLVAATLAFAVIAGAGGLFRPAQPATQVASQPGLGIFQTKVGDQQKITLSDGSVVTLNTGSRIETRINGQERTIRLLEGEAFFAVAHDATRPFRVYAGNGVTVAVGTAFSVRLDKEAIEVVVSEGKVSFSRVADTVEPVAYVAAGEAATFSDNTVIETVGETEVDRKLSWIDGKLVFSGDPLSSVVADISRYTDIQFDFASQELADMRVGGVFPVGEVDDLLDTLESNFGLRAVRVDATHVLITGQEP